jgi:hypothetical protein
MSDSENVSAEQDTSTSDEPRDTEHPASEHQAREVIRLLQEAARLHPGRVVAPRGTIPDLERVQLAMDDLLIAEDILAAAERLRAEGPAGWVKSRVGLAWFLAHVGDIASGEWTGGDPLEPVKAPDPWNDWQPGKPWPPGPVCSWPKRVQDAWRVEDKAFRDENDRRAGGTP